MTTNSTITMIMSSQTDSLCPTNSSFLNDNNNDNNSDNNNDNNNNDNNNDNEQQLFNNTNDNC